MNYVEVEFLLRVASIHVSASGVDHVIVIVISLTMRCNSGNSVEINIELITE